MVTVELGRHIETEWTNPIFWFPIQTRIKCVNKTEQLYYANTRWQNKVNDRKLSCGQKICGLTKIVFPTGIVFHTNFNDGEIDSWFLFYCHQQ